MALRGTLYCCFMSTSVKNMPSVLRIYWLSTLISVGLIGFVASQEGVKGLLLVLVLVGLEITFSFDNAVINAKILRRMHPFWQQIFLTVGILIAVFGVRLILPILLVAIATGTSFSSIVDLALNDPDQYSTLLESAKPMIAAFGGMFLFMITLDFFATTRKIKWINTIETILQKAGKLLNLNIITALIVLLAASTLVEGEEKTTVLVAGLCGILAYLIINSLDILITRSAQRIEKLNATQMTFRAGLIGFLYLEVIDASFSLDGVIGAFAITNNVLLIATGLGIGALYVRTITIHMLRRGLLDKFIYMEHGAHYAIGILSIFMLLSLKYHIPEYVTGLAGVVVITLAITHSTVELRRSREIAKNRD